MRWYFNVGNYDFVNCLQKIFQKAKGYINLLQFAAANKHICATCWWMGLFQIQMPDGDNWIDHFIDYIFKAVVANLTLDLSSSNDDLPKNKQTWLCFILA